MIFSHKQTILFISREKIQWVAGWIPSGKLLGEVQFLPWSEKNLDVALDDIASKFPKKMRIVVGEEFSYVTHFPKNDKKNSIISEAQALIPEKLQDGWDSREENSGDTQVMAVQQELFSLLKKALFNRNLKVEAIEAESIAIVRLIGEEKNGGYVFARNNGKIIVGIAQANEVLAARTFSKLPTQEYIREFMDYITKPKNILIERVYVQDKTEDLTNIFRNLGLEVQNRELSPMVGICRKRDLTGRDKDVLNILLGNADEIGNKTGRNNGQLNWREKILLVIFLLGIVSGSLVIYYSKKSKPSVVPVELVNQVIESDSTGLRWDR